MTEGYSFWLMPSGEIYKHLSGLITTLSKTYSTPRFEPHVTLLGDIFLTEEEVLSRASQLTRLVKPFTVKLKKVDYLNEYFRCLFVRAEETDELSRANLYAREIFNRQRDPKFMPHLSLMYGDFPTEEKRQIVAKMGNPFNSQFDVKSIHLYLASSRDPIKDWKILKEFPLK